MPLDKRVFAKIIRHSVLRSTDSDSTTLQLDPVEATTGGIGLSWYGGAQTVHREKGLTPMHSALHSGDVDMVHMLLIQSNNR